MICRAIALLIISIFFFFAIACSKPDAPDEASLRAADRTELERIVDLDVKVSQAMKAADDAAHAGDAGAALELVDKRAFPAADDAIRAAEAGGTKTPWGAQKKSELVQLLRDRRAAMPGYREATTSGDPEKILASIQVQAALERRAIGAVAAIKEGR